MPRNVFSVPIFFIVFRETLETSIILSVLLSTINQLVHDDENPVVVSGISSGSKERVGEQDDTNGVLSDVQKRQLTRKLRVQVFSGTGVGVLLAVAIGAAFIAIWFTRAKNLFEKSEALWEGIFQLIAAIMIFVMGITMLRMDQAKLKWRIRLQRAFDGQAVDAKTRTGKWAFFVLPLVTVLREGVEAVVFVGGVSLGEPATAIPLAAILGIFTGLVVGFIVYAFASRTTLRVFLIAMTNLLLLIGAGLFSRCVGEFQEHAFSRLIGGHAEDAEGLYNVRGNVWHLECCDPGSHAASQGGWVVFKGIFGWNNTASIGTVLAYVFYWLAVIVTLVCMKYKEGRITRRREPAVVSEVPHSPEVKVQ